MLRNVIQSGDRYQVRIRQNSLSQARLQSISVYTTTIAVNSLFSPLNRRRSLNCHDLFVGLRSPSGKSFRARRSCWRYVYKRFHHTMISNAAPEGCSCLFILHHIILYPRFLSPLRFVPGPPPGTLLCGQFPQRNLAEEYGPVVRVVGPVGIEILIFIRPSTLQKILVTDSADYPRVRSTSLLILPL